MGLSANAATVLRDLVEAVGIEPTYLYGFC